MKVNSRTESFYRILGFNTTDPIDMQAAKLQGYDQKLYWLWIDNQLVNYWRIKVKPKSESWLMIAISFFLKLFSSYWRVNDKFMNRYWTTILRTVYVPYTIDELRDLDPLPRYEIFRHEFVHVNQMMYLNHNEPFRPFISDLIAPMRWIAQSIIIPLYVWLYIFALLPFKFAYGRQWIEYHAYRNQLEVRCMVDPDKFIEWEGIHKARAYLFFRTAMYLWMATDKRSDYLSEKIIDDIIADYHNGNLEHLAAPNLRMIDNYDN